MNLCTECSKFVLELTFNSCVNYVISLVQTKHINFEKNKILAY